MVDNESRKPNGFYVVAGSAIALALVVIVFGEAVSARPKVELVETKRAQQRIETREKLEKAAQDQLATVDWVDKSKGVVRLPVDNALKLVAVELKAKKPAPSQVKVEPPLPMPPAFDPNAAEPPPPALPSSPQGADIIRFDPPAPVIAASETPVSNPAPAEIPNRPPLIQPTETPEPKK